MVKVSVQEVDPEDESEENGEKSKGGVGRRRKHWWRKRQGKK